MDAAHAVRAVRRASGLSQRALADRTGVSARSIAAIESGRTSPSWQTMGRLLGAADLEPSLERALPPPCRHLDRYLRFSTSERLYLSLGGAHHPRWDTRLPVWVQLRKLARLRLPMMVDGVDAVGVWVPAAPVQGALAVSLPVEVPSAPELDALSLRTCTARAVGLVPVGLGHGGRLMVPPPDLLALDPRCAAHRLSLRAAAGLLHEHRGRDDGIRRAPAHRDPDESREYDRLMETKANRVPLPSRPSTLASRAWRLDGPVSLRQWMQEHRYPGVQ